MENLVLGRLIKEIAPELLGKRVERISGTPPVCLHIELKQAGGKDHILLTITLDPRFPAFFTSGSKLDEVLDERVDTCPRDFQRFLSEVPASVLPEGFVRAMSTSLRGAAIAQVEQFNRDRVLKILFSDDAMKSQSTLWIELFGRRPNAVLVRPPKNTILACSREGIVSASGSLLRPGEVYAPPFEKNRLEAESLSVEALRSLLAESPRAKLSLRLSRVMKGLSPQTAASLVEKATTPSSRPDAETLLENLRDVLVRDSVPLRPTVRTASCTATARSIQQEKIPPAGDLGKESGPKAQRPSPDCPGEHTLVPNFDLVLLPLGAGFSRSEGTFVTREFDTASDAVRFAFYHLCRWYKILSATRILKGVHELLARLGRLRDSLQSDMASAEKADDYRKAGELILANLKAVERGSTTLEVDNIHSDEGTQVSVDLDPSLSPSQNAELYFRKARKAKRTLERVRKRLTAVERATEAVNEFHSTVPEETDVSDTARLAGKLSHIVGRLRARRTLDARRLAFSDLTLRAAEATVLPPGAATEKKHKGQRAPVGEGTHRSDKRAVSGRRPTTGRRTSGEETGHTFNPRVFETSDGSTVLVGRNNRENDHITYRVASPEDLWFHSSGMPGSHVILRRKGKSEPSRKAIEEAAAVAAYFSKGRTSSAVPVIYTKRKYVHKPRGSRPGAATYEREKFLMARPAKPRSAKP
jgi:predicted ribosome quality control (RQC) complex YloA/Tae2 family protein